MNKQIYLLLSFFLSVSSLFAQEEDNSQLFIDDMLTLADKFAQPAADGAPYQAGAGWFSSAATLDKWDFRLSLHGNALVVPEKKKNFDLQNSDLNLLQIEGANSVNLPTAFGGNTGVFFAGDVTFQNPITGEFETKPVRFKGFDGVKRSYIPHAFAQVAIGLPSKTEVTLRAMPEVTIDGVTAATYGVGLKHNISQYFGYYYPENFQLAAAAAYSMINVKYGFEPIDVDQYLLMDQITVDADLWLAELIGSKRWGFFEAFAAAGLMNSTFNYDMGGSGIALGRVNAELDKLNDAGTQFKGDLGFNLHFGKFRLSSMASFGDFFNANIGVHVRI